MAGCVWTWILKLCVLTKILLLTTAQTEHMINLAINKPCNISSQYVEGSSSNNCSAAINGNTNTDFITVKSSQNCIHTSQSDFHPFWSVDLGQNLSVHRITIYGRNLYGIRMACVQVLLDGRELYKFPCSGISNVRTDITLNPPQRGRVVKITRDQPYGVDPVPFLNICEIQIWGPVCPSGYWGENCASCGPGCSNDCDAIDGACGCTNGWTGPRCTECSEGHYNESNDCQNTCGEGCHDICSRTDGTCQCQTGWQPPVCQHCALGHWGDTCTHLCGPGCEDGVCDVVHGTCNCKRGWKKPTCEECIDGHYNVSNDCHNTCGEGCHDTCSRTDGTCQCRPGYQPPLCQRCAVGYWGDTCTHLCGHGCENGVCDVVHGTCNCKRGWEMPTCEDCTDCYYNVSNDCQNTCGEGCHDTCSRTDGTCQCQTGWQSPLCQRCAGGHWGDTCTHLCGPGCENGVCDTVHGICKCRVGWEMPICEDCTDGHYNMSNDCQNTCGEGCHDTCSRTNGTCQCRPGWQSPLCQHCAVGHWGDTCTHLCGPGCENGVCDVVHGTCNCNRGWKMPTCEGCADGWSGAECTECNGCTDKS